jgi:cold-inducible RNA-binding protein
MSKLYVGNLNYETTEDELQTLFETHGEVVSCKIVMNPYTGRSKGFAFVEMATPDAANAAVEALNQTEVGGRTIKVDIAREKPQNQRPRRPRNDYDDNY